MIRFGVAAVLAGVSLGAALNPVVAAQPVAPQPEAGIVMPVQASPTQVAPQKPESRPKDRPAPSRHPDAVPSDGKDGEPVQAAECAWVGKRIVSLLTRDDAMTAGDFMPFYLRFGCPESRVGKAFGCVVRNGEAAPNDVLAERIEKCWDNPDVRFPKLATEPKPETPNAPPPQSPPANKGQGPGSN